MTKRSSLGFLIRHPCLPRPAETGSTPRWSDAAPEGHTALPSAMTAAPAALTAPPAPSARPRKTTMATMTTALNTPNKPKQTLTPQQAAQKLRELPRRDRSRLDAFLMCGCRANRAAELLECDPDVISATFKRYQHLVELVMAGILRGDADLDLDEI